MWEDGDSQDGMPARWRTQRVITSGSARNRGKNWMVATKMTKEVKALQLNWVARAAILMVMEDMVAIVSGLWVVGVSAVSS